MFRFRFNLKLCIKILVCLLCIVTLLALYDVPVVTTIDIKYDIENKDVDSNRKQSETRVEKYPTTKYDKFAGVSTRVRIVLEEMDGYLAENIDTKEYRNQKNIFVATTWRSGSTFFAEAISYHPAIFYHYEPLMPGFRFKDLSSGPLLDNAVRDLGFLADCQYENMTEYLEHAKKDPRYFKRNSKLDAGCKYLGQECFLSSFTSRICDLFPIKLFKTVRIRVAPLEYFLEQSIDTHIILLVRDPRAIYASRRKLSWCMDNPRCSDVMTLCDSIQEDISSVNSLKEKYPGQVHLVKYEDVAYSPVEEFKKIFQALDIKWHHFVLDYVELHTKREMDIPWSTYRVSRTRINKWKTELTKQMVDFVQDRCWEVINILKYPTIDTSVNYLPGIKK